MTLLPDNKYSLLIIVVVVVRVQYLDDEVYTTAVESDKEIINFIITP